MKKSTIIILTLFAFNLLKANNVDTLSIKQHLNKIINTEKPRNYKNIETLNFVADYIFNEFSKYADTVYYQYFIVNNKEYKNVICRFGSENSKTIVVGAHYDVYGNQDGADDNTSGVVGLLELAKLFKDKSFDYYIDMLAYELEKSPYFRTKNFGEIILSKCV
tara:strand:- start:62424 stop:62912 length:489 start_codon:yes stop_codon:yes gene_type:complete